MLRHRLLERARLTGSTDEPPVEPVEPLEPTGGPEPIATPPTNSGVNSAKVLTWLRNLGPKPSSHTPSARHISVFE